MTAYTTPIVKDRFSELEEEFQYEIIQIGLFHKEPPLINHNIFMNHFKILFFQKGHCRAVVKDQEYQLTAGDLLLVPVNTFYTVNSLGSETIEFVFIHFLVLPVHKISAFVESLHLTQVIKLQNMVTPSLLTYLKSCSERVSHQREGSYLEAMLLLKSILLNIRIRLDKGECAKPMPHGCSGKEAVLNQCLDYLQQHLDENLSVSTLCELCHVSQSYLYRCFTQLIAMPPSRFIQYFKIQRSLEMLKNTELSIADIAEKTGFSSLVVFSSTFKSLMGISPSQYRKQ